MKSKKEKTHAFNGHVKQNEYQPLLFDDFLLGFFGLDFFLVTFFLGFLEAFLWLLQVPLGHLMN